MAVALTYSMLEYPLWFMHFLIFFGLCVGLLLHPRDPRAQPRLPARAALAAGVIALLAGCSYAGYEYRKVERAYFLITDAQAFRALGAPQFKATLGEIDRSARLYRMHLEYAMGAATAITKDDLPAKLANNERLVEKVPVAPTISREVLLRTLAGGLQGVRWHLRRLLKFAPPSTDEAISDMRRIVKDQPERLAALGRVLDEELAAAPKRAW